MHILPLLRAFLKKERKWYVHIAGLGRAVVWPVFGLEGMAWWLYGKQASRLCYIAAMEMTFYHQPNFPNTACLTTASNRS